MDGPIENPPAFPHTPETWNDFEGMTLRDYYMGKIAPEGFIWYMQGNDGLDSVLEDMNLFVDKMLEERVRDDRD